MARSKDPAVRTLLVERAAHMLRTREPITLRSLVAGTGVSTMAVYTYFGDMDGVWRALRQEGFVHLGLRFAAVPVSDGPVRDLAALVVAYLDNALTLPDLFRVMFDASFELEDLAAADAVFEFMVAAARRARDQGVVAADVDPLALATQVWAVGHGLASLVATGPLPPETLDLGPAMLVAILVGAGAEPGACRASVEQGWGVAAAPPWSAR